MRAAFVLALAWFAIGCGASSSGADDDACDLGISFEPAAPIAGPTTEVRANSIVAGQFGVQAYEWHVMFNGAEIPHQDAQSNGSDITFPAHQAGAYRVSLDVTGTGFCAPVSQVVNVLADDPHTLHLRLHITPPITSDAPPLDKRLTINGGGDYDLGAVVLDPGILAEGTVTTSPGSTGIIAYMKFMPLGAPDAVVETFSNGTGAFSVTVLDQAHDVLVIPAVPGVAPKLIPNWMPGQSLSLDAGSAITGIVRGPNGLGLGNAKVQLTIGRVPSSLGTTAVDGSFTLRGVVAPGADVKVEVTPPGTTGLPRLEATAQFDLAQPLAVSYRATLTTRNLAGTHVRRGGVAQPNAKVTIVGALAGIGTATTGSVSATAAGLVQVTASADGLGALPSMPVPALPLTAVVNVALSDLAVTALDLTSGVPADIVALPMQAISTRATDPGFADVPALVLDLVPIGALARAGTPIVHLVGNDTGTVTGLVASGGHYDAHWYDPSRSAGPLVVPDVTALDLAGNYTLPPALTISGVISVTGNPNPIHGASVQILCGDAACTGLDRTRPIAEVASDQLGRFDVAVADPGAM